MKRNELKWNEQGLIPAIIQNPVTKDVLMMGYMNQEAIDQTLSSGYVTFYSRSRACLWMKGESSGNYLKFSSLKVDCDKDTILIQAQPTGPTCHQGTATCWGTNEHPSLFFINELREIIRDRKENPPKKSYLTHLFGQGIAKIAQKVGEEAVEVVIEALQDDRSNLLEEAADLLFHYLVLLEVKNVELDDVIEVLKKRNVSLKKIGSD
jgi:phosphoribosyl-ATP pyrophosphohydrolase/phosphoribosyl-AMP cyclohydrolase